MDKKEARALALSLRKANDKEAAKKRIIDLILASKIIEDYSHIGIYYPIGDEIDLMDLVSIYPNKTFYLPITEEEISFIPYHFGDKLKNGPFHTMEPIGIKKERDEIECFLIPCVATTLDKYRIGYGKGYYDRYLEGYKGKKIGITYKNTSLECKADSYDVLLDIVLMG